MRKKSLRAMESAVFQAPESRAEAIMQNILGANNVLVPPEAPFEEILQAILYNTPYTKEAEARIEEILLAIKNNGTYYGEPQSRDEEILISKLNQTPYTKDAESRIEELFILWAAQSIVKQLEGVPPLAFTAQGQPLINWTIYGKSGGVGDKTANLFDKSSEIQAYYLDSMTGTYKSTSSTSRLALIPIEENTSYTFTAYSRTFRISFFDTQPVANQSPMEFYNLDYGVYGSHSNAVTSPIGAKYVAFFVYNSGTEASSYTENEIFNTVMVNKGSTALPYEPWGIKIPISCGGETNTIYLDTPLYDGNSISMADTGIEIPTTNGQNTLAVDTTVQPEKVYIEYK